jgi:hypothetical protein
MVGFADDKSAPTEVFAELCGSQVASGGRPDRSAKSLKILLDDDSKSSIEWQASLIESQLVIAVLQAL